MQTTRSPAVAGSFYPQEPSDLSRMVSGFLINAEKHLPVSAVPPKALIVPHAGYIYSGPIAASGYVLLKPLADQISRVILLGPAHRVGFEGLAASSAGQFLTPLGAVKVHAQGLQEALSFPQVQVLDEAHRLEHSLEVHLPFLQSMLRNFEIVPLVVGDTDAKAVGEILEALWGGAETLIVISSDLSHYHDYQTARKRDQKTSQAIVELRANDIDYEDACGRNPIQGLLWVARKHGLKAKMIDLRNSGDTAGTKDQVVGYGAYVFH